MKHVVIHVPTIHPADCRCAPCRGGRAGPARRAARLSDPWNDACLVVAIAAFILVPGRWLLAAAAHALANLPL